MAAKEHLINFSFVFDDDAVSERIAEKVERVIYDKIYENIEKIIFGKDYYGKVDKNDFNPFKNIIGRSIERFFEENKDMILDQSIQVLIEKMTRTKAYREAMKDLNNKYKNAIGE